MHADLVTLGFTGSYSRVAAFAREWRGDRHREQQTTGRGTFVPLSFSPGEAFQFDWSEDFAVLGGERTKLQVAHIKLSHSLAFLLRAYPGEHKAIIDQKLWDEVHEVIANNRVARAAVARTAQPALLRGLIFTESGAAMMPHHTKRKGKRYC
jgi:hypothetical protein